jgi:hypothetical protein
VAEVKVLSQYLPVGTKENQTNLTIASLQVEI